MSHTVSHAASHTTRPQMLTIGACLILGVVWVSLLWGVWSRGVDALGWNATYFLILLGIVLYRHGRQIAVSQRALIVWMGPLVLIGVSYSLFENPFIKLAHIAAIPIIWAISLRQLSRAGEESSPWDVSYLVTPIAYIVDLLPISIDSLIGSVATVRESGVPLLRDPILWRIAQGLFYLLLLAGLVVVPLLASADPDFALLVTQIAESLQYYSRALFELSLFQRCMMVFVVALLALTLCQGIRMFEGRATPAPLRDVDGIVSSIVIAGLLVLYGVFLWLQVERIVCDSLPMAFAATEQLVKSGFWQLIVLSLVNVLLFFGIYRRAGKVAEQLLAVFCLACLVLLLSAAHRMWLYVTLYGLSYEKFFASYAVCYCILLFGYLLYLLKVSERGDVLKSATVLCFWMYGLVSIAPVEQIILRTNIALAAHPESRLKMDELTMLSADVLGVVTAKREAGSSPFYPNVRWQEWLERREQELREKSWLEYNLSNLLQ